jgi:hypothetical protein
MQTGQVDSEGRLNLKCSWHGIEGDPGSSDMVRLAVLCLDSMIVAMDSVLSVSSSKWPSASKSKFRSSDSSRYGPIILYSW